MQDSDAVVVDVRTKKEYEAESIAEAVWIPVDEFPQRWQELPQDKPLLFICRSGVRSALAAEYAVAFGLNSELMYSVDDGVSTWLATQRAQAQN